MTEAHELSAEQRALHEEAIITPPSAIHLIRTPRDAYVMRLTNREPHLAETYHANSKIRPGSVQNLPMDEPLLAATTNWFVDTAYNPRSGDFDLSAAERAGVLVSYEAFPEPARSILDALRGNESLFRPAVSLDIWMLVGASVYRLPASRSTAWLELNLEDADLRRLSRALLLSSLPSPVLMFVGIAPWRVMAIQGVRGYRRCLLDAGEHVAHLRQVAVQQKWDIAIRYDYIDAEIDTILNLDGIERSIVAVAAFDLARNDKEGTRV